MFQLNILGSGSSGNCVIIDDAIMLDAGLTKKLMTNPPDHESKRDRGFGYDLDTIQFIFVSHEHNDHKSLPLLKVLVRKGIPAYLPEKVCQELEDSGIDRANYPNIHPHYPQQVITQVINDETYTFTFHPQRHKDIVNYAIVIEKGDERLLYVTDIDTIGPSEVGPGLTGLGTFDVIAMEGNYDVEWLHQFIEYNIQHITGEEYDATDMNDEELTRWVRNNYKGIDKKTAGDLFRAAENLRHLSKQQARAYVINHLRPGGRYYEIHRSSKFYERPSDWQSIL